jgi:tungstate transport system substrate-binding protein
MFARILSLISLSFLLVGQNRLMAEDTAVKELKVIFPVTCVSPGLANGLAKLFEKEYKIPIKMITLCTGDAIKFIKSHEGVDDVDAMMGHDYDAEEIFEKEGFVVNLREVCYSDFVLVGPAEDPAKIKDMKNAVEAVKKIAAMKVNFCSRADSSGSHSLEMRIWKLAKINPDGDWYIRTKLGTSETLIMAAKKRAYFISQWASYTQMKETIDLVPIVDDKEHLFTNYEIMAMNPERFPKANYVAAMTFIGFLTSPETQKYIGEFGIEKFHRQSFIPLAVRPEKQRKEKK